jgi:hypothetical protein
MTVKRTFANVCSISDRHVLDLLPLFDLRTSDPLFDGESPSWQPHMAKANIGPAIKATNQQTKQSKVWPDKPLTAIEPSGS